MECKTNRESVKDLEEDLETNSDIALWKYIGPKIGEARNILFSAILDILDKSKSEEHILKRDSLNSIHWKSAKKSIWTLSTTTDRQGSLRNIHLDSSVFQVLDNLSCTTDNKGTSRQSFNFRNQSTENLEKVVVGRKNAVCVRLNRKAKTSTDIAKLSVQQKKHVGTSSMGLFSQDSIASKKSYYSVKRKKNLVIKCDYSNKSHPLSKHVLQVYQHQSSQVVPEEKSTNVSNEKLLVDKEISKETKGESREFTSKVANTTTVNMSVTNIACEKRNCKKSRIHKKSLQHKWSFMSLNRCHVNRRKHEVGSNKTSTQSTSYRAKFSKILSKLFNAGLQFSSITHRKEVDKRKNFHDSSPSVTPSSSDTSTLSADNFRISSKYRTYKKHGLPNRRSCNIPPPVALSYNNIPCAAPLFVPILNLPGSEQCKKELRKPCKPPDNKPSINSSFRLYPRSSKTRKFIDSFCGLKSRILASASRGKALDTQTPPSSSRTSIFSSCNSKTKYDLNSSMEKLPDENRPAFSPTRREEIRRESPTSRFEIPNGLRYERRLSPKIVASEIESPRRPTFDLPGHPIMVENSDSSNSDLAYSDNSFTLLSKEAFFSAKPRNTEPCGIPERKYSYDTLKYSMLPPKRSSPEDIFSTRHLYERPKVDHPCSPPSSENDFHYQNSYYPYQYIEHPSTPDEHMYYRGDNTHPQYLSAENVYPPSSMFSRAPPFMPARPISCPLPGKLPNLPPHLIRPQPPISYYNTDPHSPPYYTYTGSQSYFVDPFTSCSTRSPTSSGSSVHYPLDPSGRPYSYRHDVPSTRSFREHLWYPHGQNMLPKVFDYQKYVNPDDQEKFARFGKSRSLSVPAYPMESFGSEYLLDPNFSPSKVRRRKMPKYMGYPHPLPQGPFNIMHSPNHPDYPHFAENPRELTQPSRRFNSRKHLEMDIMNRPNRKRRSTKSSCHSILLDQRISTRKGMGRGKQLAHSSSSVASITFNSSPKYEPRNSSGSCSDVSVSRSSATIILSKYKSIDGKYEYQYRSNCTSSKTQTSESIMNFQSTKRRKKRVSCDCSKSRSKPMPLERNEFNAATRHNSSYRCKQNEIPSASYRNMIGLRSQVCSSATDVYWNLKLKYGKIKHFDDRIKFELQKIGIDQLIEASKPAKCCKQTILNQPTKGNLPYAASLASLPLDDTDIKVIKQSVKMASKKKDFNCGDSPETRKKLMYYANILSDDYNMRKPKVEPQFEIRYTYYKLYDEKNVKNLVNKKYNKKVMNKFHRLFSFLLERPIHNPKLIIGASLNDHFEGQSLVKSVFEENRYFANRPTILPHDQSRLLRGHLVIESGNPSGLSESSKVALCYNIDERNKFFSNFSSCSQPQLDELLFKDERPVLSRFCKKLSSMNIPAAFRNFKKKTKKCLNSEEFIPKMSIYDLNELTKSHIIESIVDKHEMIIVYSVQCFESRICLKNICQHTCKFLKRSTLSTPSIQLRLESCLSGLEAILRIIANFKTYVEKAITDDDKLLDNLEQYLRLKMHVSISDTFNNAINFEVNIDKLENGRTFYSSKGKLTEKTKCLFCKSENYGRNEINCCDKNRRLIKLIHQNQIVYSGIINPKKSLKLMQELVTKSRNYSNEKHFSISTSENERFRQEQTYLGNNFQEVISEGLNNNHIVFETQNESSGVEFSVFGGEEFLSKHFLRNLSKKSIYNNEGKLIIDLNEMNIILVQHNSRHKKRFFNPSMFFSFPNFSPGDNHTSCFHNTNKIIELVNNFHDSKISFLQMMSCRKDIDILYIHCEDFEISTSKCRILCTMKRSAQLDYSRHILSNVTEIIKLCQCILRDYIFYSRTVFLNRNDIVDKLKTKPLKLIKYSMYSTEILNCLLNQEEINSLERLEEYLKNIYTALLFQMWPLCSHTRENQIQNETVENYQLFGMVAQLCIFKTLKTAKHLHNQHKTRKMKRGQQKKNLLKKYYKSSYYNSSQFKEYHMDIEKESRPSSEKLEIEDEKSGDYGKQSGKRCQQKFPSEETKVTTILPCLGTSGGIVQRNGDSLESLLDDCLENGKLMNQGDNQPNERRKTINYKMVEDTLMECLNFKGNSDSLQGMSHTILRYFTYTVFSEIKKNYYKHLSRKHRHSCCKKHQDFSIAYFNSNHTHGFPLGNLNVKHEEMVCGPKPNKLRSKNDISSNQNHENRNITADSSLSVSNIEAKISSKDAFLCNLPNAPPFILKMNKTSFGSELTSEKEEASKKDCKEACAVKNDISSIMYSLELDRASHTSSTLYPTNKGYSEMSEHNLFIDNTCPTISNRDFRSFLGKSISFIKNSKDILQDPSRGCFMSSPTVCLTGLSGFSISPFTMDEKDSRKRCQYIAYRPSTDILSNETSHQHQSKIPRMLHPGKYKVHTKMKNVQLTSGSKGYGKSHACSSRGCRDHCSAENNDVPINTIHNVANTCPSKTKTCAAANARSEKRGSVNKNWSPQKQSSQPPVGDCVKGIKSDPGCYCPNIRDESIPCPVRLTENFPMDEEETPKEEEDNENMCYCAPGEQRLLMKKSNIECDCANRNRCENETLVEPPVEKPNVFWALTKVSLLKDGTKNFEIIDVSPLPPGYYLMPEANNLILVGPQPKPVKGPPNKNCTCK